MKQFIATYFGGGIIVTIALHIHTCVIFNTCKWNVGCKIGNTFLGVFGYADDLTLYVPCYLAYEKC